MQQNLYFRPRNSNLSFPSEDVEDVEEEADEVVPDGVEEVELARVNLERKERMQKLLLDDIRKLSVRNNVTVDLNSEKDGDLWMITGGRAALVRDGPSVYVIELVLLQLSWQTDFLLRIRAFKLNCDHIIKPTACYKSLIKLLTCLLSKKKSGTDYLVISYLSASYYGNIL